MTQPAPATAPGATEPTLGRFFPIILPWDYELQFWNSPVFVSTTRDIDAFNLFTRVCENWLILFRCLSRVPLHISRLVLQQYQRTFAFAVLHVAFKVLSPQLYAQIRLVVVGHFR
jgi:hypothetical protein